MKKILLLFVLAGLVFSTNACKKKECPKPEVRGAGTWDATKIVDPNGQELDNTNPAVACYLTDELVLNQDHNGTSWVFPSYDSNTGTCSPYNFAITSWAENLDKNKLYVSFNYQGTAYDFGFTYTSKTEFYWDLGSGYKEYYEKQ